MLTHLFADSFIAQFILSTTHRDFHEYFTAVSDAPIIENNR